MIDFWNMEYKEGGKYVKINGQVDPTPYLEKNGCRYSIGGIAFIYFLIISTIMWIII